MQAAALEIVPINVIHHSPTHPSLRVPGLCKLDLQLVSQTVESIWLSALYPVNAMRNRALANARTDAVLLLDVDFWPSAELSELMQVGDALGHALRSACCQGWRQRVDHELLGAMQMGASTAGPAQSAMDGGGTLCLQPACTVSPHTCGTPQPIPPPHRRPLLLVAEARQVCQPDGGAEQGHRHCAARV